jgi:hypothetical protein
MSGDGCEADTKAFALRSPTADKRGRRAKSAGDGWKLLCWTEPRLPGALIAQAAFGLRRYKRNRRRWREAHGFIPLGERIATALVDDVAIVDLQLKLPWREATVDEDAILRQDAVNGKDWQWRSTS